MRMGTNQAVTDFDMIKFYFFNKIQKVFQKFYKKN